MPQLLEHFVRPRCRALPHSCGGEPIVSAAICPECRGELITSARAALEHLGRQRRRPVRAGGRLGRSDRSCPTARPTRRSTTGPGGVVKAQPCRYCTEPTWLADQRGPAHPCCALWMGEQGMTHCPACRTAAGLRWHDTRRRGTRARPCPRATPRKSRNVARATTKAAGSARLPGSASWQLIRAGYHALGAMASHWCRSERWSATDASTASALASEWAQ